MPLRHTCAHVAKPPHCDLNASALRLASLIAAQIERGEGLSSFLQSLWKSLESWGLWRPRQGEAPAHAGEAKSGGPFDDGAAPVTANSARRLPYKIGLIIMILSLGSGLATYAILTGLTPIVPTHLVVVGMLLLNLVLVLAMVMIIAWQVTGLWLARRRQVAGAQLHVRIVSLFSVIAVVPAILLAIFASVSLDRGLDRWFSTRTKSIIQNSVEVATAYVQEHGQVIRADTLGMAKDIDEAVNLVKSRPQAFGNFLSAQASIRALPIAYLIDGNGKILATAATQKDVPYQAPPTQAMELAKSGQAIVIAPGKTALVGAIKALENFNDTYLYVIRPVNAQVLQQLRATRANVAEYQLLEQRRAGVQVAFGLMYVAMALTLLLSAIWIGMWFANRLVAPIRQLMGAAQQISEGNLDVAVNTKPADGDLAMLGSTFNTMTSELKSQRDALVGANSTLDERRRFMEAVLSGVTAGVVGLDPDGTITLVNRSAEDLLNVKEKNLTGKQLADAVPEFGALMKRAQKQGKRLVTDQISLLRAGQERNFAVRVTTEGTAQQAQGYVLTFDDITELVSAQRSTAWADVARRIAHEIKNPLTPIQLSAERIRRKYGDFDHQGSRRVRAVHRHHHPPGVGHRQDGRRVLRLRAHAEAGDGAARHPRDRARGGVPVPGEPAGDQLRARFARETGDHAVRPPASDPGRHQPRQECERGHRYGDGSRARPRRQRSRHRQGAQQGRSAADHGDRQWLRTAEGEPPAAGRALYDHARQRHRPWARDRAADHRAAWRNLAACRCAQAERQGAGSIGAHGPSHPRDGRGACAGSVGWERRPATSNSPRGGRVEEGATHGV